MSAYAFVGMIAVLVGGLIWSVVESFLEYRRARERRLRAQESLRDAIEAAKEATP